MKMQPFCWNWAKVSGVGVLHSRGVNHKGCIDMLSGYSQQCWHAGLFNDYKTPVNYL